MSRSPQLLLGALLLTPWAMISARDMTRAERRDQTREATAKIGEIIATVAIFHRSDGARGRRCPHPPGQPSGTAGPTPPLTVECHRGPEGRCRPSRGEGATTGLGVYPAQLWSTTAMWRAIGFRLTDDHAFHYSLTTRESDAGCIVEVEARADLDGDGDSSTIRARARLSTEAATIDPSWELRAPLE